jgi:hypothetical protein
MFHTEHLAFAVLLGVLAGCGGGETGSLQGQAVESCMLCHNGSLANDYSGPGIENPHPFVGADSVRCTVCHGGNGSGTDQLTSHVPPPPQIGDEAHQLVDARAYFNRLTLAGIDKYPNYVVDGQTHTALEYLQFVNPGDLRVVTRSRGCGQCHQNHAEDVSTSLLATEAGIFSGARFAAGEANVVPENAGLFEDTAADVGWRAVQNLGFSLAGAEVGAVSRLIEAPEHAVFGASGPLDVFNNPQYFAAALADDRNADNSLITDSPLANLFQEQVTFTCGDCHLGARARTTAQATSAARAARPATCPTAWAGAAAAATRTSTRTSRSIRTRSTRPSARTRAATSCAAWRARWRTAPQCKASTTTPAPAATRARTAP